MNNLAKLTLLAAPLFFCHQSNAFYRVYPVYSHFEVNKSYAMGAKFFSISPAQMLLDGKQYIFSLTNKGIYLSHALKGYHFIFYPGNVQPNEVKHIHAEYVHGTPTLMLTAKNNRIYRLNLNLTNPIWRMVHIPNINYGSYTINDFSSTPDGKYYLASDNGLYFHKTQPRAHSLHPSAEWKFYNQFPNRNLINLSMSSIGNGGDEVICANSEHILNCNINGQWTSIKRPADNNANDVMLLHTSDKSTDLPKYNFRSANGIATLNKNIYFSMRFAPGEDKNIYRNGRQQIPLYVDVCAEGPNVSITDSDKRKIERAINLYQGTTNRMMGYVYEGPSDGYEWSFTRNNYLFGKFSSQARYSSDYQQTTCDNGSSPVTIVTYIQTTSNDRSQSVYASMRYVNAGGNTATVSTKAAINNTVFNINAPIQLTKESLNVSKDNFYCPGGCSLYNDSATKRIFTSKAQYPQIYRAGGMHKRKHTFSWTSNYRVFPTPLTSGQVEASFICSGRSYTKTTSAPTHNAIVLITNGCINSLAPFDRGSETDIIVSDVFDVYGNITNNLYLGSYPGY